MQYYTLSSMLGLAQLPEYRTYWLLILHSPPTWYKVLGKSQYYGVRAAQVDCNTCLGIVRNRFTPHAPLKQITSRPAVVLHATTGNRTTSSRLIAAFMVLLLLVRLQQLVLLHLQLLLLLLLLLRLLPPLLPPRKRRCCCC